MHERCHDHGGLTPPRYCWRAFGRRRNCDFCDAHTHMHEERRVSARRGEWATHLHRRYRDCSGDCRPACWRTPLQSRLCNPGGSRPPRSWSRAIHPPTDLRLLRCTNAHAAGAAGISPPWLGKRTCKGASAIARQTAAGELADAVAIALPPPLLWRSALNGNRIVFRIAGSRTTGGLRPPALVRALACRQNCDFCDAQTHTHQERQVSARRGSR